MVLKNPISFFFDKRWNQNLKGELATFHNLFNNLFQLECTYQEISEELIKYINNNTNSKPELEQLKNQNLDELFYEVVLELKSSIIRILTLPNQWYEKLVLCFHFWNVNRFNQGFFFSSSELTLNTDQANNKINLEPTKWYGTEAGLVKFSTVLDSKTQKVKNLKFHFLIKKKFSEAKNRSFKQVQAEVRYFKEKRSENEDLYVTKGIGITDKIHWF